MGMRPIMPFLAITAARSPHMKLAWQIGVWFHRAFKDAEVQIRSRSVPPQPPKDESEELRAGTGFAVKGTRGSTKPPIKRPRSSSQATAGAASRRQRTSRPFWEQMAAEVEAEKTALQKRLAAQQAQKSRAKPPAVVAALVTASNKAASERGARRGSGTRKLIDQQLRARRLDRGQRVNCAIAKGRAPAEGKEHGHRRMAH
jgi:type I restriction enzyme R subunit